MTSFDALLYQYPTINDAREAYSVDKIDEHQFEIIVDHHLESDSESLIIHQELTKLPQPIESMIQTESGDVGNIIAVIGLLIVTFCCWACGCGMISYSLAHDSNPTLVALGVTLLGLPSIWARSSPNE